jgi:hypothetical protein
MKRAIHAVKWTAPAEKEKGCTWLVAAPEIVLRDELFFPLADFEILSAKIIVSRFL